MLMVEHDGQPLEVMIAAHKKIVEDAVTESKKKKKKTKKQLKDAEEAKLKKVEKVLYRKK